jgi:hypothetical protein
VAHALAQHVHVLEGVAAPDVLHRPLLALDALGGVGHHVAHALEPGQGDVGADVDDDQPLQLRRVVGRELDRDAPAHRVADEREAAQAQAAREGGHVVGHRAHPVVVVGGGIAVAVPALVEREHAPGRRQALREVVPHPGVPGDAVQQDHRRGVGGPPVEIVQRDAVDLDGALEEGHAGQSTSSSAGSATLGVLE